MTIIDPTDIPGLLVWYSAKYERIYNAHGKKMFAGWHDLSGNNNHATYGGPEHVTLQTTGGPGGVGSPQVVSAGGHFVMPTNIMSGVTESEIFASIKTTRNCCLWKFSNVQSFMTWSNPQVIEGFGRSSGEGGVSYNYTVNPYAAFVRYHVRSATNDWEARMDEVQQAVDTSHTPQFNATPKLFESDGFNDSFVGYSGYVVLFDRKLTDDERDDMDAWGAANMDGGMPRCPTINDPRDIPGLLVWYSPEAEIASGVASGTTPSVMTDLSGNGHDGVVVGTPKVFATGGPGGDEYLQCAGATGALQIPDAAFSGLTGAHVFLGIRNNSGVNNGLWRIGDSPTDPNRFTNTAGGGTIFDSFARTGITGAGGPGVGNYPLPGDNTWTLYDAESISGTWYNRMQGQAKWREDTNTVTFNAGTKYLGYNATDYAYGLGLFLLFDRAITDCEYLSLVAWGEANLNGGVQFIPPPPADPTNLVADPGCTTATITWDAVEDADGYEVRLDGGAETDVGTDLTYEFTPLTPGTSYDAEVRAYNGNGPSGWTLVTFTTDSPPSAPGSITVSATTNSVTAFWSAVPGADGYRVRLNGGAPVDVGDTVSHGFTGLTPGTYTVEVQSYNDCGDSDWLAGAPVTTLAQIVAQPCPCGDRWVIEACDLATGRVRAILLPVAASWQTILTGLGTGDLTFPVRGVLLRDVWPDLTSVYISRITDTGEYDCQYAGIVEKATGTSTIQGGTMRVGLQPIESYLWRRTLKTDRTYTATEQTAIAASLVSYAATNGIPLTAVAAASTFLRDRTYLGDERPYLGELLDLLSGAIDGPEWTMLHTRSNGFWSSRILFEDRAGDDRTDILTSDVEGATYGLDVDAGVHATYVDGYANTSTGQIIATAVDNGPYVEFDATPSFGTIEDGTTVQQQSDGYLREHREPVATPSFGIMGDDDPTPENLRLGDTATFHITQGAVSFHGRARVGSISWRLTEGAPAARVLGLIPVERASDSVLNQ